MPLEATVKSLMLNDSDSCLHTLMGSESSSRHWKWTQMLRVVILFSTEQSLLLIKDGVPRGSAAALSPCVSSRLRIMNRMQRQIDQALKAVGFFLFGV